MVRWHTYDGGVSCPSNLYVVSEGGGVFACQDFPPGGSDRLVRAPINEQPVIQPEPEPVIREPILITEPWITLFDDKKGIDPKLIIIAVIALILLSRS